MFTDLRAKEETGSDGDSEAPNIQLVAPEEEEQEAGSSSSEAEKIQVSLPEAHVPLGLIAKLSIDNNNVKGKKERTRDVNLSEEDLNDDNVVRVYPLKDIEIPFDTPLLLGGSQRNILHARHDFSGSLAQNIAEIVLLGPAYDLNRRAMLIEQHSPPEILVHGLVNPDDVQNLFDMYVSILEYLSFPYLSMFLVTRFYQYVNVSRP
jgi:hypothetical protein